MPNIVLASGDTGLVFDMNITPAPVRMSSTASTATCLEQIFPPSATDPDPKTEDWMNFIGAFDPTLYDSFSMSAFTTSVIPRDFSSVAVPSMVFRTVYGIDQPPDFGGSAYLQVDGINDSGTVWDIYSSNDTTEATGVVNAATFEFSATSTAQMYGPWNYLTPGEYVSANPTTTSLNWVVIPSGRRYSAQYSGISSTRSDNARSYFFSGLSNSERTMIRASSVVTASYYGDPVYYVTAMASASSTAVYGWDSPGHVGGANRTMLSSASAAQVTATASISSRTVRGGYVSTNMISTYYRSAVTASSTSTGNWPTLTRLASAETSGPISAICGDYTGSMSATVGCWNDWTYFNPSGVTTYGDGYPMRDLWSAGLLVNTPQGCGLSGIIELHPKPTTLNMPLLTTAEGE